jgi:hypothetical protein
MFVCGAVWWEGSHVKAGGQSSNQALHVMRVHVNTAATCAVCDGGTPLEAQVQAVFERTCTPVQRLMRCPKDNNSSGAAVRKGIHSITAPRFTHFWKHVGVLIAHLQEALNAGTAVLGTLQHSSHSSRNQQSRRHAISQLINS